MKMNSFDQWLKANPDLPQQESCPVCEGDGRHECECGHSHRCENCVGTGVVGESREARALYEAECDKARAMLVSGAF